MFCLHLGGRATVLFCIVGWHVHRLAWVNEVFKGCVHPINAEFRHTYSNLTSWNKTSCYSVFSNADVLKIKLLYATIARSFLSHIPPFLNPSLTLLLWLMVVGSHIKGLPLEILAIAICQLVLVDDVRITVASMGLCHNKPMLCRAGGQGWLCISWQHCCTQDTIVVLFVFHYFEKGDYCVVAPRACGLCVYKVMDILQRLQTVWYSSRLQQGGCWLQWTGSIMDHACCIDLVVWNSNQILSKWWLFEIATSFWAIVWIAIRIRHTYSDI